tara:strand:+ start:719 stop:2176 length:1458 start_codon:yes stop_codon:yes gene_type:complete
MTTTQVDIAPQYTPRQWAVLAHRSGAKVKVLWVHRRGGKGWFGLHEGLAAYGQALALETAEELVPGFHAWTVAPSYPQARQSESELEAFLPVWSRPEATNWDGSRGHNKAEHMFALRGSQYRRSGLWEVKSAHEPESLQTVGLDFLHVQECQDVSEAAFLKLLPTLRSPNRLGLSVWEGIPPNDPNHWFARLMHDAQNDLTGRSGAFIVPYTDNPDLSADVIAEIEQDREVMLDRAWLRMYMVELATGEGSVLGDVDGCITGQLLLDEPEEGHKYVMGIDVAKKVDFTVITVMDKAERRLVWHRRFGRMDWVVQEEAIMEAYQQFRVGRIKMDSTGVGDPLYDRLFYRGLPIEPFLFTNESKYRLLTDLAVGIERRYLSYPAIPIMLREMKSLQPTRLPSGRTRIASPNGGHDDYPMSLGLCYSLCDPPPEMGIVGRLKSVRYVPTQAEVNSGVGLRARGAQRVKERHLARFRQRLERLGLLDEQ